MAGTLIHGIGASSNLDSVGEVLDIHGLDISSFERGEGVVNFEHKSDLPAQTIGKILSAKKIFSEEDCETDSHRYFWDSCKTPYVYVLGELFDEFTDAAKDIAGKFKYDFANKGKNKSNVVHWSIEGSKIAKSGMVVTQSLAKKVTITSTPANRAAIAELVPPVAKKDDLSDIFKSLPKDIELFPTKALEVEVIDPKFHANVLGITPMEKSESLQKAEIHSGEIEHEGKKVHLSVNKLRPGRYVAVAKYPGQNDSIGNTHTLHFTHNGKDGFKISHEAPYGHNYGNNSPESKEIRAKATQLVKEHHAQKDLKKTLTAGGMGGAPSTLTNGAALAKEDLGKKMKKAEDGGKGWKQDLNHPFPEMEQHYKEMLPHGTISDPVRTLHVQRKEHGPGYEWSVNHHRHFSDPAKVIASGTHQDKIGAMSAAEQAHYDHYGHGQLRKSEPLKKMSFEGKNPEKPIAERSSHEMSPGKMYNIGHKSGKLAKYHKTTSSAHHFSVDGNSVSVPRNNSGNWLQKAEEAYKKWDKKDEFEKFMSGRMPHLSKGEIKAFGQTLALQKSLTRDKYGPANTTGYEKGIHTGTEFRDTEKPYAGQSDAGSYLQDSKQGGSWSADAKINNVKEHKKVLSEMKAMKKPNLGKSEEYSPAFKVGKTSSGKDIHAHFNNPAHADFSPEDHSDANKAHGKQIQSAWSLHYERGPKTKSGQQFKRAAEFHIEQSKQHDKASRKSDLTKSQPYGDPKHNGTSKGTPQSQYDRQVGIHEKGVHNPKGDKKGGHSSAGTHVEHAKDSSKKHETDLAKLDHKEVVKELKSMPKPKLPS